MTYPADPNQPYQYQPDQSAWSQGQPPPNTGGFYPGQPQPGYGDPQAQPGYGAPGDPMAQGAYGQGPTGPTPPKGGKPKGLIALIAALAVAVVGLGVGLVLSLNRSDTASSGSSTVTVTSTETETAAGSGGAVETVTETVTEPGTGGEPSDPTADPEPGGGDAPSTGRVEGVVGEPLELIFTDYDDVTSEYTVTVHTAEWKDALEGDYVDPPVDAFLVLDVTIESTKGTVEYYSGDWTAKDVDGREYDDAFAFGSDLNLLSGGTLAEGEKVRGAIVFDMPRGESTLIYSRGYGDLGVSYKIPG